MLNFESILKDLKSKNIFIDKYSEVKGSFNSKTFTLEAKNGEKFFLKNFINDPLNKHNRLKSEVCFTKYVTQNKKIKVPKLIEYSEDSNWILYQWIEGKKITKINREHVENLIDFLININKIEDIRKDIDMPYASEASFTLNEHKSLVISKANQTKNIINNIIHIKPEYKLSIKKELDEKILFIKDLFTKEEFNNKDLINYRLNNNQRCISPSDVGFHNIIESNGKIYYLDFEYAGIDDPCKLIVDLLLQPDYAIPCDFIDVLPNLIKSLKKDIPNLQKRIYLTFELYKVKWFCIIFNPIIKNRIANNYNEETKQKIIKSIDYYKKVNNKKKLLMNFF